jgi:hypothetical protein
MPVATLDPFWASMSRASVALVASAPGVSSVRPENTSRSLLNGTRAAYRQKSKSNGLAEGTCTSSTWDNVAGCMDQSNCGPEMQSHLSGPPRLTIT